VTDIDGWGINQMLDVEMDKNGIFGLTREIFSLKILMIAPMQKILSTKLFKKEEILMENMLLVLKNIPISSSNIAIRTCVAP
jgi:hypothetical protein